jgi:beta-phosphoglucomutase-like phosphatase (HAD superfamily)
LEHSLAPGSHSWFEVIGAGDVVPAKKPAPDIYHYVLERLRLPPQACLAFEDSENGIHAARGAGLITVITINDYTRSHDFRNAALVLDQLGEPDRPARAVAGQLNGAGCFTIDLARRLVA